MFDHVVFSVSDYEESKAFFLQALAPLGVGVLSEGPLGLELGRPDSIASLCIRRDGQRTTPLHGVPFAVVKAPAASSSPVAVSSRSVTLG